VLQQTHGPKIHIFRYRSKTRYRRHVGHRQKYTSIEISDIAVEAPGSNESAKEVSRNGA
jgi:large subunit ribosomal protein L21